MRNAAHPVARAGEADVAFLDWMGAAVGKNGAAGIGIERKLIAGGDALRCFHGGGAGGYRVKKTRGDKAGQQFFLAHIALLW